MGFSLVLALLQLQCLMALETEAPGAHKSGTDRDSNSLPFRPFLGGEDSLNQWLEFSGRGQGRGDLGGFQMGCIWMVLTCTGAHCSLVGGPGWESLGHCLNSSPCDLVSWLGNDLRDTMGRGRWLQNVAIALGLLQLICL